MGARSVRPREQPLSLGQRSQLTHTLRVAASDEERGHFERIARAKRDEARGRALEALREPVMKRIIEGLELGDAAPRSAASEALLDERARGQAQLHARARALGLIR